ncbi:MAG: glucuronyl hydrolase, partial [Mucinivorans sp.]
MKKTIFTLALTLMAMGSLFAQNNLVEKCVKNAAEQVSLMVAQTDTFATMVSPRKIAADGKSTAFTTLYDWTSGFYPGSLWYLYELTGENKWKESAIKYTQGMEHIKNYTGNHDIGFMIFCSFGNGLRLTGN